MYYDKGHSRLMATILALAAMTLTGVCQVGLVYAIRPSYERGDNSGTLVIGILSSLSIAVGLLPQYWEIYKRREVIGISLLFMFVDMSGGVFSDLSLIFKQKFNVLAAIAYTLIIVSPPFVACSFYHVYRSWTRSFCLLRSCSTHGLPDGGSRRLKAERSKRITKSSPIQRSQVLQRKRLLVQTFPLLGQKKKLEKFWCASRCMRSNIRLGGDVTRQASQASAKANSDLAWRFPRSKTRVQLSYIYILTRYQCTTLLNNTITACVPGPNASWPWILIAIARQASDILLPLTLESLEDG